GMFATMLRLMMLAALAACAGHAAAPSVPPVGAAPEATRWVPERPTFVMSSPALADALRDLREVIEAVSVVSGLELRDLSAAAQGLIGVDVLQADALAAIGVDVRASWAAFSDDLNPTFVVHLASADKMKAFVARQRERGLAIQTATADQIEVSSLELMGVAAIRWAIDGDWMWVHLSLVGGAAPADPAQWFVASHHAHPAAWADNWTWASRAARTAAGVVGFYDLHGALARAAERLPSALACARLAPSIGRIGFGLRGDGHRVESRLAVEIGPTDELLRHVLPPPSGWTAAASRAAVAAQWNLDLASVRRFLEPCLTASGSQLAMFDQTGVRAARGMLISFDPEHLDGAGVVALDVVDPAFFARQLDRIPMRSAFERPAQFGHHAGFAIDIPLSVTVEYLIEPNLVVAGLGEGVISPLFGPASGAGAAAAPPVFALDVAPGVMSAQSWGILLQALGERRLPGSPGPRAQRAAEHLLRWRTGHVAITAEGHELVLTASGEHL
ncbi:MAG TPA: hypothetical protein VGC42_23545, partial [Kofleriaceae bacterium]